MGWRQTPDRLADGHGGGQMRARSPDGFGPDRWMDKGGLQAQTGGKCQTDGWGVCQTQMCRIVVGGPTDRWEVDGWMKRGGNRAQTWIWGGVAGRNRWK